MPRVVEAFAQFLDGAGNPLVNGWLRFTVTGTNNTNKDTFADASETIANTNPVQLDGEGRCPNVFGSGVYRVTSFLDDSLGAPGTQIQQFDPVGGLIGLTAFSDWDAGSVYNEGAVVVIDSTRYFRSLTNYNIGNEPTVSASEWSEVFMLVNPLTAWTLVEPLVDGGAFEEPTVTGGTFEEPTVTGGTFEEPTVVGGTFGTPEINAPVIAGGTLTEGSINASFYRQGADASLGTGTHSFDFALGDRQQLTATGDITVAFTNFPTGKVATYIIDAVNWGDHVITLPVGTLFASTTVPSFTAGGSDRLIIEKDKDDVFSMFVAGQAVGVV